MKKEESELEKKVFIRLYLLAVLVLVLILCFHFFDVGEKSFLKHHGEYDYREFFAKASLGEPFLIGDLNIVSVKEFNRGNRFAIKTINDEVIILSGQGDTIKIIRYESLEFYDEITGFYFRDKVHKRLM